MCKMDTKATWLGTAAAVTGARHLRTARNGQDAAAHWVSDDGRTGAVVVCDGCGSGASSEVGARLAAQIVIGSLARQLSTPHCCLAVGRGSTVGGLGVWDSVRGDVLAAISQLLEVMPGDREQAVHDYFLFTMIAAVVTDDLAHVWAVGDGAYAIDGVVRELGPFADNMPPYLAYELVGARIEARTETTRVRQSVLVGTDGAAEIGLAVFADTALVRHPDALRRRLAVLAKGAEKIDWAAGRMLRTPAALQDDGAVALLVRRGGAA